MQEFEAFFLAIPQSFTIGVNMLLTKVAGIACSVADIAFILALLKMTYFLKPPGTPAPRKRLFILYSFAFLTPTLAFPMSINAFLRWQSFVLGVPYLVLAYSVIVEFPVLLEHMRRQIRPRLQARQGEDG